MTWVERAARSFYDSVSQVLIHKSIDLASNTVTMTKAQLNTAVSDADVATLTGTETLTGKTLTDPKINVIKDTNGNTALTIGAPPTPANQVQLWAAAAGGSPGFYAVGSDPNVSIQLSPQGSGGLGFYANTQTSFALFVAGTQADIDVIFYTGGAGRFKINGNIVPDIVAAPATATSTGKAGQIAYDSSFFYLCTAANTWKRVAIAAW